MMEIIEWAGIAALGVMFIVTAYILFDTYIRY